MYRADQSEHRKHGGKGGTCQYPGKVSPVVWVGKDLGALRDKRHILRYQQRLRYPQADRTSSQFEFLAWCWRWEGSKLNRLDFFIYRRLEEQEACEEINLCVLSRTIRVRHQRVTERRVAVTGEKLYAYLTDIMQLEDSFVINELMNLFLFSPSRSLQHRMIMHHFAFPFHLIPSFRENPTEKKKV